MQQVGLSRCCQFLNTSSRIQILRYKFSEPTNAIMVGRKLQFDREVVLERAMELFWAKGYSATCLNDLLAHMGIQRQSLYNTFGSKHELFLAAVRHYGNTAICCIEDRLNEPGSPLANVRGFLQAAAAKAIAPDYRGCFMTNAIVELAPDDPAVAAEVRLLVQRVERAVEHAIERAIAAGELPATAPAQRLARFLLHIVLGFNVRGKSNLSQACVDDVLAVAFAALEVPA